VFAFLVTYHQRGEQKHAASSWLKELVIHPGHVLSFSDPRHWSERTFIALCSQTTDTSIELYWHEVINRNASAHFIGGIPIGDSRERGAVDPYLRLFGQPGLHVMDGSVMPANPGVNPSLMITAMAERAMSLWPNKGELDIRPPLGSGYERVNPIAPHHPVVPAGAAADGRRRRLPGHRPMRRPAADGRRRCTRL
jgi:cholesterol oxidase